MSFLADKRKRRIFISISSIALILAIIIGSCTIYLSDYYKADKDAIHAFASMNNLSIENHEDGTMVFRPNTATKGFIFYPGGKVEYTAYQPLMTACVEEGILCILIKMPFNLAVFDINAAEGIQEQYPEIDEWYIGGHSLGGSMAAAHLEKNAEDYKGLILLGSYTTTDLSDTDLAVLSIYGSEDMVMNHTKYANARPNLPEDFTEIIIEGGCHSYFGMYGAQDGDGTPTITNEEQILRSAYEIAELIFD